MERPAPVPKQPVRDELDPVHGPDAQAEHPPAEEHEPRMLEHPHLAPELVLDVGRHVLGRPRPRLVDGPVAVLHHEVREAQVVAEPGVDLAVGLPAHRVDRTVGAGHRVDERLARPRSHIS